MTLIEDRLRAMLRGRLAETERLKVEAWLLSPEGGEPWADELVARVERDLLAALAAGLLDSDEAEAVRRWDLAQRRGRSERPLGRPTATAIPSPMDEATQWVM